MDKGNAAANFSTRISGFAQSCGSIQLDPGARVDDGLRPHASAEAIPKFNIAGEFDPKGQPGTIEIAQLQQPAQELDCIYRSSHDLTFNGPVKMYDSYLYVKGNLKVLGGITGTGAIVVDGDLEVTGSIDLDGSNNVALLSTGKVTLRGGSSSYQSNYFQGYVYAEKGVDAQNLTVMGSLIVNHPANTPEPEMKLDHVILVNDESQGKLTFTAQSYSYTLSSSASSNANWLTFDWSAFHSTYPKDVKPGEASQGKGPVYEDQIAVKLPFILKRSLNDKNIGDQILTANGPDFIDFPSAAGNTPDINAVKDAFTTLQTFAGEAQEYKDLLNLGPEPSNGDPEPADHVAWRTKSERRSFLTTRLNAAWNDYSTAVDKFVTDYNEYVRQNSSGNGARRRRPGAGPPDVQRTYVFDLNKYMPISDRLQVTFWQLYGRRL